MLRFVKFLGLACAYAYVAGASASPMTLDFETLADSEQVDVQFQALGVRFNGAVALKSGISLNESDFPPHSGSTALSDDLASAMEIIFASPASMISGWFTYTAGLRIDVFDASNVLLGTILSPDMSNLAFSTLLTVSFPGAQRMSFANTAQGSFSLDDLSFDLSVVSPPPPSNSVSLPSSLALALLALSLLSAIRPKRRTAQRNLV